MKIHPAILCNLLAACASTSTARKELIDLKGMSLEHIEGEWGSPDLTMPKTGGGQTVLYKKVETTKIDFSRGVEVPAVCDIELQLDAQKTVTAWEHKHCETPSAPEP